VTRRTLLLSPAALPLRAQPAFRAGFAEAGITPAIGMEQPGSYNKVFHKKLHDPCKVRAAVFDDGAKTVALAGIDGLFVPRAWSYGNRSPELH